MVCYKHAGEQMPCYAAGGQSAVLYTPSKTKCILHFFKIKSIEAINSTSCIYVALPCFTLTWSPAIKQTYIAHNHDWRVTTTHAGGEPKIPSALTSNAHFPHQMKKTDSKIQRRGGSSHLEINWKCEKRTREEASHARQLNRQQHLAAACRSTRRGAPTQSE